MAGFRECGNDLQSFIRAGTFFTIWVINEAALIKRPCPVRSGHTAKARDTVHVYITGVKVATAVNDSVALLT
jgi:hypothetical protein